MERDESRTEAIIQAKMYQLFRQIGLRNARWPEMPEADPPIHSAPASKHAGFEHETGRLVRPVCPANQ